MGRERRRGAFGGKNGRAEREVGILDDNRTMHVKRLWLYMLYMVHWLLSLQDPHESHCAKVHKY